MKTIYKITMLILTFSFMLNSSAVNAQCSYTGVQNPPTTITPSGVFSAASPCNVAGEYMLINVISGHDYVFSTCNADGSNVGYDSQLTLFNEANLAGPILEYSDDACNSLQSHMEWTATFTGVVRLKLNQYNCVTNSTCSTVMLIDNTLSPPAGPCLSITPAAACGISNTTIIPAGTGVFAFPPFNPPGIEKIYSFTPTITGSYVVNQTASGVGTWVDYFYKPAASGCHNSGWIFIDDVFGVTTSFGAASMTAGVQYYILLDPEDVTPGGSVTWNLICPTYNPCLSIAASATCGNSNTTNIDPGIGAWFLGNFTPPGKEKIYTFTPTLTANYSITQTVNTVNTFIDYFYKPTSVGCNDIDWIFWDDQSGTGTTGNVPLTAGVQYYIMLDPENTDGGQVQWTINCGILPPVNDVCTSVTPVPLSIGSPVTFTGNTVGAEPDGGFFLPTVWHAITLTSCATITLDYCATNPAFEDVWINLALDCPPTTVITAGTFEQSCGNGSNNWVLTYTNLPAGTYWIPVLADEPPFVNPGPYSLTVTASVCAVDACSSIDNIPSCNGGPVSWTLPAGNGVWQNGIFFVPGTEKVWSFTPTVSGDYFINVIHDTGTNWVDLFIKTGTCSSISWTYLDDVENGENAYAVVNLVAGTTYYIYLDDEDTDGSTGTIEIICPLPPPPDPCSVITDIPVCDGGAVSWTLPLGLGLWQNGFFDVPGNEKVFSFTPAVSGLHFLNVTHDIGSFYVDVFMQSGTCGATGWTYLDDIFIGETSLIPISLVAGTTYYFAIDDQNVAPSTGSFEIGCPLPPPPNQTCATAIPLTCGGTVTGHTFDVVPSGPECGDNENAVGVWYLFNTSNPGGAVVTVTTCDAGTTYDTFLKLFTGTCGNLNCIGSNDDDFSCSFTSLNSTLSFTASPNTDYYVFVTGFDEEVGIFTLYTSCVLCTSPPIGGTVTGPTNGCSGSEINYTVTGSTSIQWQLSTVSASGPFTDIPGANSSVLTFIAPGPGTYFIANNATGTGCADDLSNVITSNIIESGGGVTAVTDPANFVCENSNLNLIGTFLAGSGSLTITVTDFNWFLDEVEYEVINSSNQVIFTSPVLNNFASNVEFVAPAASDYPVTFHINAIGFFNDNTPTFSVVCNTNNAVLFSGVLSGGDEATSVPLACFGGPVALSNPNWTGPDAFSATTQNASLTANLNSSGTYVFTGTTATGCVVTASTTVTVNAAPVPSLGSNSIAVCENDLIVLTAFGGDNYDWSGPGGISGNSAGDPLSGSSFTFLNLTETNEGLYFVTVTNANGCSSTESLFIQINERPELYLIAINCNGANNSDFEVGVNGGTPPYTFSESVTSITNGDGIFTGFTDGTYFVSVSDDATPSCSSLIPLEITLLTTPNPPPVINCPVDIITSNSPGQCGAIVTYTTPVGTDNCTNGLTTTMIAGIASGNFFPIGNTTVTYRVTDNEGLSTTCSFNVTVNDTELPALASGSVCPTSFTGCNPVTWAAPSFTDNCPGLLTTSTHTPGTNFQEGTTSVTYTATDLKGNSTTCSFNVTVLDTSEAATSITSNRDYDNVCLGGDITLSINGGHLGEVTAGVPAQWIWYRDGCGAPTGTVIGTGTSITLSPTVTTTYYARPEGACNLPGCVSVTVTVSTSPPSSNIVYNSVPSYGAPGITATLSVNPVPGAVFYRWYTINGHVNSVLFDGVIGPYETTIPTTQVTFALPEQNYQLRVLAGNACGRTNATNTSVRGTVEAPTSMNGPTQVCPGNLVTYSILPLTNNSPVTYNWELVPASAGTITMAANGLSADVTFTAGFGSAQVCANGISTFGLAGPPYCLTVSSSAPVPGPISGENEPCSGNTYSYSISSVTNALSYNWSVDPASAGTVISVAPDGLSAQVEFAAGNFSGQVCVTADGGCGLSDPSCLSVINGTPGDPGDISGPASGVCDASNVNYSLATSNANSYQWAVTANMSMTGVTTNNSVSVNFLSGFTTGIVSVTAFYDCGTVVKTFDVTGAPTLPVILPAAVCPGTNLTYFVINAATGVQYSWVATGDIIDSACTNPECSQFYIQTGPGGGSYEVNATNDCGSDGPVNSGTCRISSDPVTMEIYPNPTTGTITVEFGSNFGGQYQVTITDLSGRVIMVEDLKAVSGRNQHQIDLGFANAGLYMIYLKNSNGDIAVNKIAVE